MLFYDYLNIILFSYFICSFNNFAASIAPYVKIILAPALLIHNNASNKQLE